MTVQRICSLCILVFAPLQSFGQSADLGRALEVLRAVGNAGNGHSAAMDAWKTLAQAPVESLPEILRGIDDSKPLGANWIRSAVDQIAERSLGRGAGLPTGELEKMVFDQSVAPRARRLAYEWLLRVDEGARQRIVPKMLNDSSLEMRRDAVAMVMEKAAGLEGDEAIETYQVALRSARDLDQIDGVVEKLTEKGVEVQLPEHFGFIVDWKLIGPFDNAGKKGFDVAYAPERKLDFDGKHAGKTGTVRWADHSTQDKYGMVDLNAALGKNMGAAAYAFAEFESSDEREVDLRLGCICAAKVWLNGELLMSHEVYHSGTRIDQYVARGKLNKGKNELLLKILQNEQTEPWAQDWQFQFRICDELGSAILSADR